jgi:hypothetical protein
MAKEQDVPLNPAKISGVCGRLLCCLAFEHELYREVRGQLPKIGQFVSTPAGNAKLIGINVPKQTVSLQIVEGLTIVEMTIEELRGQYGTAIRPAEVEEEAAAPVPETKAEVTETARTPSEEGEAAKGGGGRPRRRRRRRNGRGRPNAGPPSGQ